ncbi:DUF6931 family protein [Neomesorhizobium albiziae]|nr:hypothetical protein [Mesorhizobium albiziae]GLS31147.1 hypothetical protein GCM10007937_28560 [Mesorhizobium albiziae]
MAIIYGAKVVEGNWGGIVAMVNGLRFKTARDLFAAYPAASQDMKATPTDQPSLEFCRSLLASKVPEEAVTFCAYLLPDRAAVWWGHECLNHLTELLEEQDHRLLALVHDWVSEPLEHRSHAAINEASAVGQRTPAVWIALAAGQNGMSAYGDETSPQASSATARAVNAGILAGLARVALADRLSMLIAFVEMGIHLAEMEGARNLSDEPS